MLTLCALLMVLAQNGESDVVQEEMTVSLRQTKVRVISRKGIPMRGLAQGDFQITVNGKKADIVDFQEVDLETTLTDDVSEVAAQQVEVTEVTQAEQPTVAERHIVIIFETALMSQAGFESIQTALDIYLAQLRPTDKVSLYQADGKLYSFSGFTTDKEEVRRRLTKAKYYGVYYNELKRQSQIMKDSIGRTPTRVLFEEMRRMLWSHARTQIAYAKWASTTIENLPGDREIALFTGGGFALRQNTEMDELTDRLNALNIDLNILYFEDKPFARTSTENGRNSHDFLYLTKAHMRSGLEEMTQKTGGVLVKVLNRKQAKQRAERLVASTDHYYMLTYRSSTKKDQLEITLDKSKGKRNQVLYNREKIVGKKKG